MNESGTDLEMVETKALVDELRRRSSVFFMCMRQLAVGDYQWSRAWGVDGNAPTDETREALARVLGLIELAKFDLIYVKPNAG